MHGAEVLVSVPGRARPVMLAVLVACAVGLSGCAAGSGRATGATGCAAGETECAVTPRVAAVRAAPPPPVAEQVPRNVILMIGDGMGFTQLDLATLYLSGSLDLQGLYLDVAMSTYPAPDGDAFDGYDPGAAWTEPGYALLGATDSAAAATALATGEKVPNGTIAVDAGGRPLETVAERAIATGRAAGLVTSVPVTHATPAAFAAHEASRGSYQAIGHDLLTSDLSVVLGAGHPWFDDSHVRLATPDHAWLGEDDWADLTAGRTPFTFLDSTDDLTALATDQEPPDRVFGVAQVGSTLQEGRAGGLGVGEVPRNDVPDLATLSLGALAVLDQDPDGFFLMVEGGAIDWASHDGLTGRAIEETLEFSDAVTAVRDWVTANDSWSDTLLVVTADHETGRPAGASATEADPWVPVTGEAGREPEVSWLTDHHTNNLVPFFAQGAGVRGLRALADDTDPVRGAYLDNTEPARMLLELWATG